MNKNNRVYHCIFCGKPDKPPTKLTKEHYYPQWAREYLPAIEKRMWHWTRHQEGEISEGKLHRSGDAHNQTLRVACGACNGGWMSQLQQDTMPILLPLMQDSYWNLNEEEQRILSAWCAMFTMVTEYADVATASIPQEHRTKFMETRSLSQDWSIWIGRHDAGNRHPAYFNHHGGQIHKLNTYGSYEIHPFQTTGFTVNHLYVQTILSPLLEVDREKFASLYGLRTIFPYYGAIRSRPYLVHDMNSRHDVSNHFVTALGLSTMRTEHPAAPEQK